MEEELETQSENNETRRGVVRGQLDLTRNITDEPTSSLCLSSTQDGNNGLFANKVQKEEMLNLKL